MTEFSKRERHELTNTFGSEDHFLAHVIIGVLVGLVFLVFPIAYARLTSWALTTLSMASRVGATLIALGVNHIRRGGVVVRIGGWAEGADAQIVWPDLVAGGIQALAVDLGGFIVFERVPGVICCWTMCGQQRKILTPGKNQKRYGFGPVNCITGQLTHRVGERKNRDGFCALVEQIVAEYSRVKCTRGRRSVWW